MEDSAATKIFGLDFADDECDVLAIAYVDEKHRAADAVLYAHKWFDYRRLHPTQATFLFAHTYNEAYRRITMKSRDAVRGRYIKGFKGSNFLLGKEVGGFWKARQAADLMGAPYGFYINRAMDWCEDRNWRNFPRPAQLYSEDLIAHIAEKWAEEQRIGIQLASEPLYLADNYCQHPDQIAYQKYLVGEVKCRQHKEFALHYCMVENPHMTEAVARAFFPAKVVDRALAVVLN